MSPGRARRPSRTSGLALFLALAAGCSAPRTPAPEPRFVFQNGFWNSLHHFLRAEARRSARQAELELPLEELTPDERTAWSRGLDAYRARARRSLLHDPELVAIRRVLAEARDASSPVASRLPSDLALALDGAAPVYRARRWPLHAAASAAWIAAVEPDAERHGGALTAVLAAAYRVPWPGRPILVEPSWDCGPNLAYTTETAPPGFAGHVTISPHGSNRGPVAFECLAHEASHVVDAVLVRWIEEESARQGFEPPAELWHALLFFTSGLVAERILGAAGTYRSDVAQGYPAYHDALERHWRPYLEGAAPFERALRELVRAAAAARAAQGP